MGRHLKPYSKILSNVVSNIFWIVILVEETDSPLYLSKLQFLKKCKFKVSIYRIGTVSNPQPRQPISRIVSHKLPTKFG